MNQTTSARPGTRPPLEAAECIYSQTPEKLIKLDKQLTASIWSTSQGDSTAGRQLPSNIIWMANR